MSYNIFYYIKCNNILAMLSSAKSKPYVDISYIDISIHQCGFEKVNRPLTTYIQFVK